MTLCLLICIFLRPKGPFGVVGDYSKEWSESISPRGSRGRNTDLTRRDYPDKLVSRVRNSFATIPAMMPKRPVRGYRRNLRAEPFVIRLPAINMGQILTKFCCCQPILIAIRNSKISKIFFDRSTPSLSLFTPIYDSGH